ncbi:hypothetical protein QA600_19345 [Natronococcus sp. A-GB1]|uniref:hypothetical protein n=1 Tax=Natronococcus sp. A-GB1 TaxID=3037648 RepID=UPI00241C89C1|nr:hypothetical protein [Natronococcus sp. A-GB1]MDG5761489.1 hypothetical protein [Natronococcus sp. A-GB1]
MTSALPEAVPGTWHRAGTRTGKSNVLIATITAETTVYEPAEEAASLAALGASDVPVRSLFTVDMQFSPSLSVVGVSPKSVLSTAAPKARRQFVDIVEDEGVVVEDTRETLSFERPDGTAGRWYVLDVSYPLSPDLETDRATIPAETNIAIWPTDDAYGMAGGTLPLELPDGVAETLDGLEVDPERDRETIAALIRSVDPDRASE